MPAASLSSVAMGVSMMRPNSWPSAVKMKVGTAVTWYCPRRSAGRPSSASLAAAAASSLRPTANIRSSRLGLAARSSSRQKRGTSRRESPHQVPSTQVIATGRSTAARRATSAGSGT